MANTKDASGKGALLWLAATLGVIGALLLCILLPLSFSYLDYYELGLVRSRTTGKVDTDTIYGPGGRYYLRSPDKVFQTYQADGHIFTRNQLSVVASDKLEVLISIELIYFIKPERLGDLQREFNLRYQTVVENNAVSAIKNTAPQFATADYFASRANISSALHNAVKLAVEEPLYVTVPFFFMSAIKISPTVATKQLESAVQFQINAKQLYLNSASEVRKKTDKEVNLLNNQANVKRQTAEAEATALLETAKNNATRIVEQARIDAAALLFDRLNVTNSTSKERLDFLLGLQQRTDLKLRVGYKPTLVSQ